METALKPFCIMVETRYQLKNGTKTVWQQIEQSTHEYTEREYKNTVEAAPFFRRVGGSEHLEYGYFSKGYLCYRIISKSPDRQTKAIREFNFGD